MCPGFLCNVKWKKLVPEKIEESCSKWNNGLYNWWFGLELGHIFKAEIGLNTDPNTLKHAINSAWLIILHLLGKASKQERNVL